jgi:hypothetical protein
MMMIPLLILEPQKNGSSKGHNFLQSVANYMKGKKDENRSSRDNSEAGRG